MLLNTQGRDMTALFEAFHPFTDRPHNLLAKMKEVRLSAGVGYCVRQSLRASLDHSSCVDQPTH